MIADEKRKAVAVQILKAGWVEATPENLKAYMDGFEMAKRGSFEETGISSEEYMKRLADHKTHPIHIVTLRQMIEAAIDYDIAAEDVEQCSSLIENISIKNEQKKSH